MDSIRIQTDTYFEKFSSRYFPDQHSPFGTLDMGTPGQGTACVYFHDIAEVDALIEAANGLREKFLAAQCGSTAPHAGRACTDGPQCQAFSDAATQCTGHDRHPLPHRDEHGYEWGDDGEDEAAVIARAIEDGTPVILDEDEPRSPMCDSIRPLPHGGELKCTLDDGHYGSHSAVAGERRWLGTGDDARLEDGTRIVPVASRP